MSHLLDDGVEGDRFFADFRRIDNVGILEGEIKVFSIISSRQEQHGARKPAKDIELTSLRFHFWIMVNRLPFNLYGMTDEFGFPSEYSKLLPFSKRKHLLLLIFQVLLSVVPYIHSMKNPFN